MNFNTRNNVVSLKEIIDKISGYSDVDIREMYLCAQVCGNFSLASKIKKAYNIIKEERIEEFKKTVSDDTCESYLDNMSWEEKISLKNDMNLFRMGLSIEKPLTDEEESYLKIINKSMKKDIAKVLK